jgi:hypothetical protein
LWVGLGIGGVALVALAVVLVVLVSKASKGGAAGKKFVGRWERVGGSMPTLQLVEFGEDGVFRQGHPGWLMPFGNYKVSGTRATIKGSDRANVSINGQRILELEAELLGDGQLQLKCLSTTDKYRKVQ